jgi:DNA-binding winged helix-turn-helix (wHTH) protein
MKEGGFNGVLVDSDALRISHSRGSRRIEPKVMALLATLAELAGQLWTRAELGARLWPGGSGSDEALTRLAHLLRSALRHSAADADAVRTLPTLG